MLKNDLLFKVLIVIMKILNHISKFYSNVPSFTDKEILFSENPYPYNLEKGIMHYVLWSYHRNLSKIESLQIINEKFPSTEFEYLMFENRYTDKSVREIPHIQVFIRKKPLKGL